MGGGLGRFTNPLPETGQCPSRSGSTLSLVDSSFIKGGKPGFNGEVIQDIGRKKIKKKTVTVIQYSLLDLDVQCVVQLSQGQGKPESRSCCLRWVDAKVQVPHVFGDLGLCSLRSLNPKP